MHVALPDPDDLTRLLEHRASVCASIDPPTRPDTPDGEAERIGWKHLTTEALRQIDAAGAGPAARLAEHVEVADRYHAEPLLRAVSFPAACFLLGLSQGAVRLLEVGADYGPFEVPVEGLPAELAAAARPVLDRWHAGRLAALVERFEREVGRGRTATDLADLARAATRGAVDTLCHARPTCTVPGRPEDPDRGRDRAT